MIGLKQKITFTAKQTTSTVRYDTSTVQCAFLNTIYQGLSEKHEDLRRELKPFLSDRTVSDELLLRQIIQTTNEECERKRRLGRSSIRKVAQAHRTQAEPEKTDDNESKDKTIQRLNAQIEALTETVTSLTQRAPAQTPEQPQPIVCQYPSDKAAPQRKQRPYGCTQCVEQGLPTCSHCFACGEEGHRAMGCLKKPKQQGNGPRSRQRDNL
ncbi:hypothetical protein DPEC_G00036170 [Dallia pectoralis]|uniref:Uncharacterized protein n=1 Tax=Dallia pectoralis TaxID=75939 RepID=A0ACC2HEB5_DALPE|nr:hypothetical protein DPEC_G00036170 [Dallia pectoralis]